MKDATAKWARLGFTSRLKFGTVTNFSGVGSKASGGKHTIPCGLRLEESHLILPGRLDSHEMPNSMHPLLISQACQAKLGFRRDVRDGTITMKDHEDQNLEVARQTRTGFFIHEMYRTEPKVSHLLIPSQECPKPLVSPGQEDRSPMPERIDLARHAYVLTPKVDPFQAEKFPYLVSHFAFIPG